MSVSGEYDSTNDNQNSPTYGAHPITSIERSYLEIELMARSSYYDQSTTRRRRATHRLGGLAQNDEESLKIIPFVNSRENDRH